jgi:mannose-6-phosphate isomerase-like protein (cupin superfamily)
MNGAKQLLIGLKIGVNKKVMPNKVTIEEKLSLFSDYWNPRIIGELNGQHIKIAKLKGEFVWHKHDNEDEMFLIVKGKLKIEFRDKTVELNQNEFIIVPKGVEHKPVADEEVEIMLFEPITTLNTGNTESELTRTTLEKL